jgi:SAM-dependent methyltransferase
MDSAAGWARLPVDDVGYFPPSVVLDKTAADLRRWVRTFERNRYEGWRNHSNLWRASLGLDSTFDRHVIDYGCGFGIEALQFARAGNRVTLMDLTEDGLLAARKVLEVFGFQADTVLIGGDIPAADVFYANGVLHHAPNGLDVLSRVSAPETRLMVYSDRAWSDVGGPDFWRQMDEVGGYADWYSPETLADGAPDWTVRETTYITPKGWYLTATLDRRV